MQDSRCSSRMALSMVGMFVMGCAAVINQKFLFEIYGYGKPEYGYHRWRKPWFFSTGAALGMSLSLLIYYIQVASKAEKPYQLSVKRWMYIAIPSFFDLFASVLSNISVLYLDVSVVLMLRGSTVLFTGLISKFYLRRDVFAYQWIAIFLVLSALMVVSIAAVMGHDGHKKKVNVGIGLTVAGIIIKVLSKLLLSVRLLMEEDLMHVQRIPSVLLVGVEGIWCLVFSVVLFLPMVNALPGVEGNGIHEDFVDTCLMLGNNKLIAGLFSLHVMLMVGLTIAGMIVTETTNAVFRTLFDLTRIIFVWLMQIILRYAIKGTAMEKRFGKIGEDWSSWSYLQLTGFAILIFGMFVYGKVVRLPCVHYPAEYAAVRYIRPGVH